MSDSHDPQNRPPNGPSAPPPGQPGAPAPGFAAGFTSAVGDAVGPKVGVSAPGTVITASVITVVCCAFFGLITLIQSVAAEDDLAGIGIDLGGTIVMFALIYVAICVLVGVGAFLAMKGSNAWRITVVVFGSIWLLLEVFGLVGSLAVGDVVSLLLALIGIAGPILAIVFYFQAPSNHYFAAHTAAKFRQTGF